jgi:signal transduction histidine kinase/CheY-like chemotaxis protein
VRAYRALAAQLRWAIGDPIVRLAVAVAALAYLPYVLPVLSPEARAEYGYGYRDVPLVALLVAVYVARARRESGSNRRFFGLLAAAFGVWLSVYVLSLLAGRAVADSLAATFVEDLLWVAAYLLLALTVQLGDEGRLRPGSETSRRKALETAAAVLFTFGLLVYFVVLPGALNPEAYGTYVPSVLLYCALDAYLLVGFLRAAFRDRGRRSATLGWLAAAASAWLATDLFDALGYLEVIPSFAYGSRVEWIYLPGTVLAIVAGRARPKLALSSRIEPAPEESRATPMAGSVALPLLLVALHFALHDLGALDSLTRPAREVVLLVLVVSLALLGVASQRLLERENDRLATERTEALVRVQESRRLESLGRLTAGIAHDFNNLLTVILGTAEVVEGALTAKEPELAKEVHEITVAGERGARVISQLLAYARQQRLVPRPTALPSFIRSRIPRLMELLPAGVTLSVRGDDAVPAVLADATAIERVLVDLVKNACDAMPDGGELMLSTDAIVLDSDQAAAVGVAEPGRYLAITVADTGVGMDAATAKQAVEPFFTTKSFDSGSGLGLAMVYGIAVQHGGGMTVSSAVGRGTTIVVYLPAKSVESPFAKHGGGFEPKRGAETVLVVEDQEAVRRIATRVLEQAGYRVLEARDGREGLEVFRQHRDAIGLIVSDVVMPEVSGFELLAAVRAEAAVPFLFTSGFAPEHAAASGPLPPEIPFIHKPWSVLDFLGRVREVLDGAATAAPDERPPAGP